MTLTLLNVAAVVEATQTAYMVDAYGEAAWRACARLLLIGQHPGESLTVRQVAAFMRSKHMRWADDSQGRGSDRDTNSGALLRYITDGRNFQGTLEEEAERMALETYGPADPDDPDAIGPDAF